MDLETRMFNAIEFVESNLENHVTTQDIAEKANMSVRNFQRHFSSLTGSSVQYYVRSRRLTEASIELVKSDISVLDSAIKYQFDSYEGFSRAFKRTLMMSPDKFRKVGSVKNALHKLKTTRYDIEKARRGLVEGLPIIKFLPGKKVVGVKTLQENYAMNTEDNKVICNIARKQLMSLKPERKERINEDQWSFSFRGKNIKPFHVLEKFYGYEVRKDIDLDQQYSVLTIPSGQYAIFRQDVNCCREVTIKKAFDWLRKSNYFLNDAPCMYRVDANDDTQCELYIPISQFKKEVTKWWQGYSSSFQ